MSRWTNAAGVTIGVDDSKDYLYEGVDGFEAAAAPESKKAPAKKAASSNESKK